MQTNFEKIKVKKKPKNKWVKQQYVKERKSKEKYKLYTMKKTLGGFRQWKLKN